VIFFCSLCYHRYLHSFPTRRSSDLLYCDAQQERIAFVSSSRPETFKMVAYWPAKDVIEASSFMLEERTAYRANGSSPRCSKRVRSEEHTSELQSRENLVCRLLLEKK